MNGSKKAFLAPFGLAAIVAATVCNTACNSAPQYAPQYVANDVKVTGVSEVVFPDIKRYEFSKEIGKSRCGYVAWQEFPPSNEVDRVELASKYEAALARSLRYGTPVTVASDGNPVSPNGCQWITSVK